MPLYVIGSLSSFRCHRSECPIQWKVASPLLTANALFSFDVPPPDCLASHEISIRIIASSDAPAQAEPAVQVQAASPHLHSKQTASCKARGSTERQRRLHLCLRAAQPLSRRRFQRSGEFIDFLSAVPSHAAECIFIRHAVPFSLMHYAILMPRSQRHSLFLHRRRLYAQARSPF